MMNKEDYMFTVGFQGNAAVVDSVMKRRYGRLSVAELCENGLYKPAICAAIADGKVNGLPWDESEMAVIVAHYNANASVSIKAPEEIIGVFGVPALPADIGKIIRV
jgi:hypothetical protein